MIGTDAPSTRIVVAGAGLVGLFAASELVKAGHDPDPRSPPSVRPGAAAGPAGSTIDTVDGEKGYRRVDGVRLFYRSFGAGEPVIVVHGGPSPGHGYLLPWMRRLGHGYRVILFDQRGTGRSDGVRDSTSLTRSTLVEDIEGLRRALGVDGRFHLFGHSWGGLLALEYAFRHPQSLRSLVLISSTEPGTRFQAELAAALESRRSHADSSELAALFRSEGFRRGDRDVIERIYQLTYRPWLGRRQGVSRLSFGLDGEMASEGRRTARLLVDNSPSPHHWAKLSALEVRVLVLHGDRDPIPVEMARTLVDSLPRARLEVLDGVGHFPFAEAPERFFRVLRRFLQDPSSPPPPVSDSLPTFLIGGRGGSAPVAAH